MAQLDMSAHMINLNTCPPLLDIAIKICSLWCITMRQSRHASGNKGAFNVMIYPRYLDRHLIAAPCAGGQRWMLNVTSGLLSASLPLMRLGNFFISGQCHLYFNTFASPAHFSSVFFFLSSVIDQKEDNMSYLVDQRTKGVSFHLKNH